MTKRKSRRKGVSRRVIVRKNNDVSTRTLMVLVILVLVVSTLSVGLYAYAFFSDDLRLPQNQSGSPVIEETGAVSGVAAIQIIKDSRAEESQKKSNSLKTSSGNQ